MCYFSSKGKIFSWRTVDHWNLLFIELLILLVLWATATARASSSMHTYRSLANWDLSKNCTPSPTQPNYQLHLAQRLPRIVRLRLQGSQKGSYFLKIKLHPFLRGRQKGCQTGNKHIKTRKSIDKFMTDNEISHVWSCKAQQLLQSAPHLHLKLTGNHPETSVGCGQNCSLSGIAPNIPEIPHQGEGCPQIR